jgi:hypothetical protein
MSRNDIGEPINAALDRSVRVRGVSRRFGGTLALDNVDLSIGAG